MKKIILVFSLVLSLLFSFNADNKNKIEEPEVNLLSDNSSNCDVYDSIVNITTTNNLINVSGFIVYKNEKSVYIATSYLNYNKEYNYEIVFSDYSRYAAGVVGYVVEDEILLFKVNNVKANYCSVTFSKSELIDRLERVDIIGSYNYHISMAEAFVNSVGLCKNCNEETFKNYYYTLLTVDIDDYLIGSGVFDKSGQLIGIITSKLENYNIGVSMLDVNKLVSICYGFINEGLYQKNYLKYNLLNVNSLTNYEKYLYSLNEGLTSGVLVSSVHYLNYFKGGLNQGMVIYGVNGTAISNCYQLDSILSLYKKGSIVKLNVKTMTNTNKIFKIKL